MIKKRRDLVALRDSLRVDWDGLLEEKESLQAEMKPRDENVRFLTLTLGLGEERCSRLSAIAPVNLTVDTKVRDNLERFREAY